VGGLGATLFQPGSSGYSDELRPSLNLGIGYQMALADSVALRLEARGYATLVHSGGGLFCSGGCLIKIKGDTVEQGEVQLGLSYRF
jgi:opacity protein-like surface antigen